MQLASAYQLLQPLMMPPRLLPTDGRPSRVARAAINSRSPLYDQEGSKLTVSILNTRDAQQTAFVIMVVGPRLTTRGNSPKGEIRDSGKLGVGCWQTQTVGMEIF